MTSPAFAFYPGFIPPFLYQLWLNYKFATVIHCLCVSYFEAYIIDTSVSVKLEKYINTCAVLCVETVGKFSTSLNRNNFDGRLFLFACLHIGQQLHLRCQRHKRLAPPCTLPSGALSSLWQPWIDQPTQGRPHELKTHDRLSHCDSKINMADRPLHWPESVNTVTVIMTTLVLY